MDHARAVAGAPRLGRSGDPARRRDGGRRERRTAAGRRDRTGVLARPRRSTRSSTSATRRRPRSTYRGDWFTLGDVGHLDEDGWLFLTDRSANLIITGGVNVYPAEVDAVLLGHPAVGDVAVIGVPSEEWGEEVKAVVEVQAGVEPSDALAAELIDVLPRPTRALQVPANGRLHRRVAAAGQRQDLQAPSSRPVPLSAHRRVSATERCRSPTLAGRSGNNGRLTGGAGLVPHMNKRRNVVTAAAMVVLGAVVAARRTAVSVVSAQPARPATPRSPRSSRVVARVRTCRPIRRPGRLTAMPRPGSRSAASIRQPHGPCESPAR